MARLQAIDGVGSNTLQDLHHKAYADAAEKELQFIQDNAITTVAFTQAHYPERLKYCIDGPILLFWRGNINLANKRVVSVVGTRNMTSYGQAFCEAFIADLAPLNPVIISGFAYGVDICAQRQALKNNLATVGCLAHGLDQIYPKPHAPYCAEIERHGGFITEFHSGSNPERENFLKRNRIIAGISEATVVVESGEKGGSLVTADIAHSYDRDVFAVPGRTSDTYSKGCNNLIKQQKAHMITSAADLVYLLNWELPEKAAPVQQALFVNLSDTENEIYEFLQRSGKQLLDAIALDCQLPVYKVSATLTAMEMKGAIRPLPGKYYEAI